MRIPKSDDVGISVIVSDLRITTEESRCAVTNRLYDEQPCSTCGGTKTVQVQEILRDPATGAVIMGVALQKCSTCNGMGVTRTPVTCAGCRWWQHLEDGWGVCLRTEVDSETHRPLESDSLAFVWGESLDGQCALMTAATHGCTMWTAKEATDGNG